MLDLGWRGIATPLARLVGPLLRIPGFSFLNDSGVPLFRYTTGETTIHASFRGNVAVVSLEAEVVKEALDRQANHTGLAAKASRELLERIRLRSADAVRILVDTKSLSAGLASGSPLGAKVLAAVEIPDQSMLDVELSNDRLRIGAGLPVSISMPELEKTLDRAPATLGVLRYVPASAYLLTISNIAPLGELYRLVAAFQGKDVQGIYDRADSGARSVTGLGIDELLFSWVGAELGAFLLPESAAPVFFARITDERSYRRALAALTGSVVANQDSSLVLDEVRIDRLSIPWFVGLILDLLGVDVPEPYFLSRGDYFFLSLDAANLSAVVRSADTGSNLAQGGLYAALMQGIPADPTLLAWYDIARAEPFFLRGSGLLSDVLRLYSRGLAIVRATPDEVQVTPGRGPRSRRRRPASPRLPPLPGRRDHGRGPGVPLRRFERAGPGLAAGPLQRSCWRTPQAPGSPRRSWRRMRPSLPETDPAGRVTALWAVSSGGTVWRLGPGLQSLAPFPIATGITGGMPPALVGGQPGAVLEGRLDPRVRRAPRAPAARLSQRLEAPLFLPPDVFGGRLVFYPKSFDARIHLTDLQGTEAPGWPVQASGISFCAPRFLQSGQSTLVTFLTQAGLLHAWDLSGNQVQWFPVTLPGVFYATPEPMIVDGRPCLIALAAGREPEHDLHGREGQCGRPAFPTSTGRTPASSWATSTRTGGRRSCSTGPGPSSPATTPLSGPCPAFRSRA